MSEQTCFLYNANSASQHSKYYIPNRLEKCTFQYFKIHVIGPVIGDVYFLVVQIRLLDDSNYLYKFEVFCAEVRCKSKILLDFKKVFF